MSRVDIADFDYNLPHELIAQRPVPERTQSKLLVLNRSNGAIKHKYFYQLPQYLQSGDLLVVNDTKVLPARLVGAREKTGGRVEILLNTELTQGNWEVIGRNLKKGESVVFANSKLRATVLKESKISKVAFNILGEEFFSEIEKVGEMPLPPYIHRETGETKDDRERYQTVYAKKPGSAAAPTAGLHFTQSLLDNIKNQGITVESVTLQVGLGTFAPLTEENIRKQRLHKEFYSIRKEVYEKIIRAKKEGRRIIAVGTTTTRVLETVFSERKPKLSGETDIFIMPGYEFKIIDGLITNFHLPKSSLLMLVCAFAGRQRVMTAYQEAVREKYRFFSYGDAMLII